MPYKRNIEIKVLKVIEILDQNCAFKGREYASKQ